MTLSYTYKTEPYAHQKRALAKIAKLEGKAGLFMPMRTGKTKTAIDWAGIAYHNYGLRRVLIVCPISVIDVWADEIGRHSPVSYVITTLRNTAAQNGELMREFGPPVDDGFEAEGVHWIIVNYEMVWRYATKSIRLDELIARWKPDLVIADEAHKLKNRTSQQSKALARLSAVARMRLALTGTPVTKEPLDLFGLFRFADTTVFGTVWKCNARDRYHSHTLGCEGFADRYADWEPARYDPRVPEVARYKNLDDLVARVRAHSFRIKLSDVVDMPEKTFTDVRVQLSPAARKAYDEMAQEMITELDNGAIATANIVLTKLIRLAQITSGFIKDENGVERDIDDGKLRALMDIIDNAVEQDEKVVVFCRFKHDYHRISEALTKAHLYHGLLTGETPQKGRTQAIADFQTLPTVKVIVCQIQSGSLGIDLSAARLAVFYSWDYNWATYVQAQDRILSLKNIRPLGYYHLIAQNTVDAASLRVLRERGSLAKALLHEPQMLLDGSGTLRHNKGTRRRDDTYGNGDPNTRA